MPDAKIIILKKNNIKELYMTNELEKKEELKKAPKKLHWAFTASEMKWKTMQENTICL